MRLNNFLTRSRSAAVVVAVLGLGLTACTAPPTTTPSPEPGTVTPSMQDPNSSGSASAPASESPSASPSPSVTITPSTDLSAIKVSEGAKPTLTIPTPWGIDKIQAKVIKPGTGTQKLTESSTVTLNYSGYNGRTGKVFDSSYEAGKPATFSLQGVVPGFKKGLTGQTVGSRVLIAMPSADGYAQGNPQAGIEVGDTILFVVDIISANFDEATGTAVKPDAALPVVTLTGGKPELAKPNGAAPAKLVVQPLIAGTGPKVAATSTIQVKYRSWVWASGELLEDAWQPQQGQLSTLIEGWKQGLVGQPTGSRVMLVVPPELAYPDGAKDPKLEAGQTLVYVIDLLYAVDGA